MTTTLLKVSKGAPQREAISRALRQAGLGVVEVEDWEQAAAHLRGCNAALVVCDGDLLDAADPEVLSRAIASLAAVKNGAAGRVPPDVARSVSHELRTPLSAMAGWLHLLESGKLDAEGTKRAIAKLRGNIDDQVQTIDRYLGASTAQGADKP